MTAAIYRAFQRDRLAILEGSSYRERLWPSPYLRALAHLLTPAFNERPHAHAPCVLLLLAVPDIFNSRVPVAQARSLIRTVKIDAAEILWRSLGPDVGLSTKASAACNPMNPLLDALPRPHNCMFFSDRDGMVDLIQFWWNSSNSMAGLAISKLFLWFCQKGSDTFIEAALGREWTRKIVEVESPVKHMLNIVAEFRPQYPDNHSKIDSLIVESMVRLVEVSIYHPVFIFLEKPIISVLDSVAARTNGRRLLNYTAWVCVSSLLQAKVDVDSRPPRRNSWLIREVNARTSILQAFQAVLTMEPDRGLCEILSISMFPIARTDSASSP